ncbi:amino acid permease, partial [Streptococcus pyogenes]
GLFPNKFVGLILVMLSVNYAFSGVEMIGIAASETDNPKQAVPKAIKSTIGLLVTFFCMTMLVLASLLPMDQAGVVEAP